VVQLKAGVITFPDAASRYSTDKDTKNQEGRVASVASGSRHNVADLDPETNLILSKMKPGDVSEPVLIKKQDGSQAYAIYRLDGRIEAHRATLEQDFEIFREGAQAKTSQTVMDNWVNKKLAETFVSVNEEYTTCSFGFKWFSMKQ